MTGHGHRAVTFMVVGSTTGSPLAAAFSLMGAVLPDSLERVVLWGDRSRYHRRLTHWFIPWLVLTLFCFHHANWSVPSAAALVSGREGTLWGCASFWLMGCLLHILEDACCGTVPLLNPWRASFGIHLFRMAPKAGEMSAGEMAFTLVVVLFSLAAWAKRGITL
ncbi:MAG: metal-dependent hydrolase [Fretibacterium sp.]|nr:metal-dependent hydrolase [Fretibacterium sp.]